MTSPIAPADVARTRRWARRVAARLPGFDPEEAVGIALLALVEASRTWDPAAGASLATYARQPVRWAILQARRSKGARRVFPVDACPPAAIQPQAEHRVYLRQVARAAEQLPLPFATVLDRCRLAGETQARVGQALRLSTTKVQRMDARLTSELEARLGERRAA